MEFMVNLYAIHNIKVAVGASQAEIETALADRLPIASTDLLAVRVVKESVDARRNRTPSWVLQLEFETQRALADPLPAGVTPLTASKLAITVPPSLKGPVTEKPKPAVVIGSGPAGMFATLALVEAGMPVILLERGKPVETRMRDIGQLRSHGHLDPESNVCFGEGGAGTYTDGKLYTRVKDPLVRLVMQRLVDFGASDEILVKAHPHLGTDKLVRLVKRMRQHLQTCGADVRFQSRVDGLIQRDNKAVAVRMADGSTLEASHVVLAIGHSARDTLAALMADGVRIEGKPFAVGVRVEHPQAIIDQNQYGTVKHPLLGAADYRLTYQHPDPYLDRRGVYSFCMCPGGFIVPSPTEPDHMAINGMSNANRSTPFANSGIVVQVTPEDLIREGFQDHPLAGIAFQRSLEKRAFEATAMAYASPGMRICDFMAKRNTGKLAASNFRPKIEPADLWQILPPWIAEPLKAGLADFNRKIKGYTGPDANILAVESRTSSPIRIPRGDDLRAEGWHNLYPVGEGAGYAGGIVSAAVDGFRAAAAILAQHA